MPAKTPEPAKVMDVTHPHNTRPDTTSRPVIVTNRPMIAADPMIAQSAVEVLTKSGVEKSTTAKTDLRDRSPELVIDREIKASEKAASVSLIEGAEPPQSTAVASQARSMDGVASAPPVDRTTTKLVSTPAPKIAEADPLVAPANNAKAETLATATEQTSSMASSFADSTFADVTADESTADESLETEEQKQQVAMETLIASGKYAVPIGRVAKRRARVVLLVVSTLVLLLLALDLLLDMGIISLPAGVPHTTFFSI